MISNSSTLAGTAGQPQQQRVERRHVVEDEADLDDFQQLEIGDDDPLAVGMVDIGIFLVLEGLPEVALHELQEGVEIGGGLVGSGPTRWPTPR